MRSYEILLILPADADDKVVQSVTDRITGVVSGSGGEITKVDRWGKRRFAYELDKLTEGFYLLVEIRADPESLRELDRVISLADEVIRFKITVRRLPEPSAASAPQAQQAAAASAPQTEQPEPAAAPA
jgi:small subunit ribosomal protein S6